jgi:hypothetical protein
VSDDCGPIACSLDAGVRSERVEEWRAMVASSVSTMSSDATTVRLVLDESDAALLEAASLGQREKACCPFFEVSLELTAETRTLSLRVPEGAEEVLAAFVAMLRS